MGSGGRGRIVGEAMIDDCQAIKLIDFVRHFAMRKLSGVTVSQCFDYLGGNVDRQFYLWQLTDVKEYDEPKAFNAVIRSPRRPPVSWAYVRRGTDGE